MLDPCVQQLQNNNSTGFSIHKFTLNSSLCYTQAVGNFLLNISSYYEPVDYSKLFIQTVDILREVANINVTINTTIMISHDHTSEYMHMN